MKTLTIIPVSKEESILRECKDSLIDPYIVSSKNVCGRALNIVLKEQKNNYDKFLCVDSDIAFTKEQYDRILSYNLAVISGAYEKNAETKKNEDCNAFVGGKWHEDYKGLNKYWVSNTTTGITKVDWCGNGFLAIDKKVLNIIEYPYFRYPVIDVPGGKDFTSPDIGFCLNCESFGVDIYIDCDCKVRHLTR